ncbi:MAG: hypothetical protein GQ549_02470 [Gammaproteobacteria bacterium]|nr:hypothetical protein [Gammaproteobacteria bacterium]
MKTVIRTAVAAVFIPISVTGCLSSGGVNTEAASVMVSEVASICGALVGDQAEQRINQEWAKYPEAEANRSIIEVMAETLLNNPEVSEEQRVSQYKKYMTCATGLLAANGLLQ